MNNRPIALALLTALSGAAMYGLYAGLAGAAAVAVPACTETDGSIGLNPITGIVVRSQPLTAGHGCGTQPGQVFKYAAVVTQGADGAIGPIVGGASAIYDCFADGTFSNLAAAPYDVYIYAFDAPTWNANAALIQCAVQDPSFPGGCLAASEPDASVGTLDFDQVLTSLSTWRTTCSATQQANIEVLAVCGELTATGH